jgi:hypothetical protein
MQPINRHLCPKCGSPYMSCQPLADGLWEEYCLRQSCDYRGKHKRFEQEPIEFKDRRNHDGRPAE